ncbi:MAG: DUF302 domain-containing protein [Streptosporangiaceae bacterium]
MIEDRAAAEADVVTKLSCQSVAGIVARLTDMITAKGMRPFAVIDQAAARQVGLTLQETTLVIFGSPRAGMPVMAVSPLAVLDLPLKMLIWADQGQTKVSYYAPAALAASHHLVLAQASTDAINRDSRYSYGEAIGITQTIRNYGTSVGFAILGTVLITRFRSAITSSLTGRGLPGPAASAEAAKIAQLQGGNGNITGIPAFIHADFAAAIRDVLYGDGHHHDRRKRRGAARAPAGHP